ncbi:MAG: DUF4864 domain-containing protein [Leptolyngbya sp. SIO1E4]|nr:DUF4864 domain-containing protein [Leptolyngbya sp. SIO1E4]
MGEHFLSEPALVPNSAQSAERSLSAADLAAIQTVITQQITAFQADEAAMAFSFASPEIQARFQTADQFMDMVRSEYPSVYRPQSVNFEAVEIVQGSPVQAVTLLGPAGQWVTAFYQMERQADDTWRIAGCILIPLPGETI